MQVQLYALFFGGIDDLHHFRAGNAFGRITFSRSYLSYSTEPVTSSAVPFLMASIFEQSFAC